MVRYWQWNNRWLFASRSNKVLTKSIESGICDYYDAYILVTGDIVVTRIIAAAGSYPLQRKQPLAAAA